MAANMLDGRIPVIGEQLLEQAWVYPLGKSMLVQEPLNPPIQEDVLDMLRLQQALQQYPSLGHIEVLVVHGHKCIERPIAFGVHPQIHIAAVLVRTVGVERATALTGKIPDEEVTGVGMALPHGIDGIKHRCDGFRSGVGSFLIAQQIARKLIGERNTVDESTLVRTADGSGESKGGGFEEY